MPSTQNRLPLSRALADHDQRPAVTLKALQFSDSITASAAYPSNVDEAKVDATSGAVALTLPAGAPEIIGLPFLALKTDSSANGVSLARAGTDTFAGGGTSISTTVQNGRVGAYWDGSNWRDFFANSSGSGSGISAGAGSLTIGDGTGSPLVALNKLGTGTAAYQLKVGSVVRGDLQLDASENVLLQQRDAAGAVVGALSFNNASGAASFSKALTIATGGLTITAGGATITTGGLTISAGGLTVTGTIKPNLPNYADNAAALAGGLVAGDMYRIGADPKVVV
jgi:hypothetical protein